MPEKRSSLRLSLPLRMKIEKGAGEAGTGFKIEVILSDISAGGAYFETNHWQLFQIGRKVNVTIQLPEAVACEALGFSRLRCSATVSRTQPAAVSSTEGASLKPHGVAIKFDRPLSFI